MSRLQVWFWPFAVAGLGLITVLCVAWSFNPFAWAWARLLELRGN